MKNQSVLAFASAGLALATAYVTSAAPARLTSPDRHLELQIQFPESSSGARPGWSASFHGRAIGEGSMGLQTDTHGELMAGARVLEKNYRSVNELIPVLFGKTSTARNQYREARFLTENRWGHRCTLVFRCFNDAIAFRYELSAIPGRTAAVTVLDERTSFQLQGDPKAYMQPLENYRTSHEHEVQPVASGQIPPHTLLDLPLTFSWNDGTYAAITEASLRHYAGMALQRDAAAPGPGVVLVARLTPRADGTKVVRPLPMHTPWRVILIGDRPGALLESETLYALNEPPVLEDTSWIKPGKITFSWWNGDVYDGRPGPPILSYEMAKRYIDFCASHGISAHALTSTEGTVTPWYQQSNPGVNPGPDTDVTRPRPGFELGRIRDYARSKGVRLWTWVHQAALRGRVEEAFTAFEKLGWSGMMVDFFDHDDQESVEFAESILEAAARHHILIHLHGVWKPTGWQRTFPNLMNHEAALNLEYLKWSDRCTPGHDLMMAFTRLIAGPMDYHLGGFRAVPLSQFKPVNVGPNVLGSRAHMLAMYVCFDNPVPMVADYPAAYENQPGFDFITTVPTWWDETRVLQGQIGEWLVTARRKGKSWYVGGLGAHASRQVDLALSFLGSGRFNARLWLDGPDTATHPNGLIVETRRVSSRDILKIRVGPDGGFVGEFSPVP